MINGRPDYNYNNHYFNPTYRAAFAALFRDILTGLGGASSVAVQAIMAIDLYNEGAVYQDRAPLNQKTGVFVIDGVSYDLSNAASRQQMIDASSVNFVNVIRSAIRAVVPDMLVGLSVFTPRAVGRTGYSGATEQVSDPRQPLRPLVLWRYSDADYIDIHSYTFPEQESAAPGLESAELSQGTVWSKPILMGEFGAFKAGQVFDGVRIPGYSDMPAAARALQTHMASSCGYGMTGWGSWTWNAVNQVPALWTAIDSRENGINGALAPAINSLHSHSAWPRNELRWHRRLLKRNQLLRVPELE